MWQLSSANADGNAAAIDLTVPKCVSKSDCYCCVVCGWISTCYCCVVL